MTQQVKYFKDSGEEVVTLEDELATDGTPHVPHQEAMYTSPWPPIVFVLASLFIVLTCAGSVIVGLAWIFNSK